MGGRCEGWCGRGSGRGTSKHPGGRGFFTPRNTAVSLGIRLTAGLPGPGGRDGNKAGRVGRRRRTTTKPQKEWIEAYQDRGSVDVFSSRGRRGAVNTGPAGDPPLGGGPFCTKGDGRREANRKAVSFRTFCPSGNGEMGGGGACSAGAEVSKSGGDNPGRVWLLWGL